MVHSVVKSSLQKPCDLVHLFFSHTKFHTLYQYSSTDWAVNTTNLNDVSGWGWPSSHDSHTLQTHDNEAGVPMSAEALAAFLVSQWILAALIVIWFFIHINQTVMESPWQLAGPVSSTHSRIFVHWSTNISYGNSVQLILCCCTVHDVIHHVLQYCNQQQNPQIYGSVCD